VEDLLAELYNRQEQEKEEREKILEGMMKQ
jgi:hypothetical protein